MIHISAVYKLIEEYEGTPQEFDITYVSKSSGRLVKGRCVCTSSNFSRRTINVKFIKSKEQRTLRTSLILKFNNTSVFL